MIGLLLTNGYGLADGITHQVSRLKEEFKKLGVEVDVLKNNKLIVYVEDGEVKTTLKKYDFIVYLDKDKYVARMLEKLGYRIFNSSLSIELCDDKMLTHIALANHDIKMPLTISSTLCYRDDGNRDFINYVESKIKFPMIVKENYGSLGRQVYLISSHDELLSIENKLIHVPHIYQELIDSSFGKDYRIIVINHQVIAYMKRENKHSYLSNLARGGKASRVNLDASYLEMAVKASKILDLSYCGVDILEGKNNKPILSEVNSNAFYDGIETVTHINIASAYAKHIIKTISDEKEKHCI